MSALTRPRAAPRVLAVAGGLLVVAVFGVTPVGAKPQAVKIVDFGFEPKTVTVNAGEVVTWTNTGARSHTVTADNGSFDSGALAPGDPFANLFEKAGTFTYRCTIHPTRMKGTVIVKAVAKTPAPSGPTPPPGTLPPDFKSPSVAPSLIAESTPTEGNGSPTPSPSGPLTPVGGAASYIGLLLIALVVAALVVGSLTWSRRRRR
jgi:plastocyanin